MAENFQILVECDNLSVEGSYGFERYIFPMILLVIIFYLKTEFRPDLRVFEQ